VAIRSWSLPRPSEPHTLTAGQGGLTGRDELYPGVREGAHQLVPGALARINCPSLDGVLSAIPARVARSCWDQFIAARRAITGRGRTELGVLALQLRWLVRYGVLDKAALLNVAKELERLEGEP
jgi:hypothetical protein